MPSLSWRVHNQCADIGTADIKIQFAGKDLYAATLAIPAQATVGNDLAPTDLKVPAKGPDANAFWTVGSQTIDLVVTGNGSDSGPYHTSAQLNVVRERIDATWWSWAPPPGLARWKMTYAIAGTFSNRALAALTLTGLTALEHPTDIPGAGQDAIVRPLAGPVGTSVPVAASLPATWAVFHAWPWVVPGTFVELGPRSRIFSYIASASVTDEYGNVYPTVTSVALLATVSVGILKVADFDVAKAANIMALGLFAAAIVVAALPYPADLIAIALGLIAAIMFGVSTFALLSASDPPIPDFREDPPLPIDPRRWTMREPEDESQRPLYTLALLLSRAASARFRAVRDQDAAWAAYLDRRESDHAHYCDAARDELETLRRLVAATVDTADEAQESFERLLDAVQELPSPDDLRARSASIAEELRLDDVERAMIEDRLSTVDEDELAQSLEALRADGLRPLGDLVRRLHETTANEIAEREYLQ
jgi:hypothetical protein